MSQKGGCFLRLACKQELLTKRAVVQLLSSCVWLLWSLSGTVSAQEDHAQICDSYTKLAAEINQKGAYQIGEGWFNGGVSVSCEHKVFQLIKRSSSLLKDDFPTEFHDSYVEQIHTFLCPSIKDEWTQVHVIQDKYGEMVDSVRVSKHSCSQRHLHKTRTREMPDPFYFVRNEIPVQLKDVKFYSREISGGLSFSFMEGDLSRDYQMVSLPLVSDSLSEQSEVTLRNLLGNNDEELSFEELDFLSQLTRYGAVFRLEHGSNRVMSVPESPEVHFLVEKSIVDQYGDEISPTGKDRISKAFFNVGSMLQSGHGVDKDEKEAIKYLHRSAELEHAEANYTLGALLSRSGEMKMSHNFMVRGARFGSVNAQYNVAVNFFNGESVERDVSQAFFWALLASKRGDRDAPSLVQKIQLELDAEARERISAQVQEMLKD